MTLALVTGGSGYFGGLLAKRLRSEGFDVRLFDVNDSDLAGGRIELIRADIRDRDAIEHACRDVEVVFHNAAQVPLAKDAAAFWSVNYGGTRNLLEACANRGVRKVVHTSSSAVYGVPASNPVNESTPPNPDEAYGKAKLAAEEICEEFANRGLDVTIVRPRTIMGHGRLGIMQILFEWVRLGRNVPVLGRGDNRYQFVHADDLADACLLAAARPGPGAYNIGAERFGTMRQTLSGLVTYAATGSRVVGLPMEPAVRAMDALSWLGLSPLGAHHSLMYGREFFFDTSKARAELGWHPRRGNVEMFCESYDWYLAHRDEVLGRRDASAHSSAVKPKALRLASWILGWLPTLPEAPP